MTSEEIIKLIEQHQHIWNEKDEVKRIALMQHTYSPDIEMTDAHFTACGYEKISGFIKQLQDRNPYEQFSPLRPIDAHSNIARLFWQSGTKEHPAAVTGMDVFVIENERISKLYVFLDSKD